MNTDQSYNVRSVLEGATKKKRTYTIALITLVVVGMLCCSIALASYYSRTREIGATPTHSCTIPEHEGTVPNALESIFLEVAGHISGTKTLSAANVKSLTASLTTNIDMVGKNLACVRRSHQLVTLYEKKVAPLFSTKQPSKFPWNLKRSDIAAITDVNKLIALFILDLQQGIIDKGYNSLLVESHQTFYASPAAKFESSEIFPGNVTARVIPDKPYTVKIKASKPLNTVDSPVMFDDSDARRPTGLYLPPGVVATVMVPERMVNSNFKIRVGCHSWDLTKKPFIRRNDRVSIVYPIRCRWTRVASPIGGGIYIEVPFKANLGVVEIQVWNVVQSPFFSLRGFDKMTDAHWSNTQVPLAAGVPWADYETDRIMFNAPSAWCAQLENPVEIFTDWDLAMDGISKLLGKSLVRGFTVSYSQTDVIIRGNANYPGYPMSNDAYDPYNPNSGPKHWVLNGGVRAARGRVSIMFHELGHSQLFTKFPGEVEAVVNFPYVAVFNSIFGVSLDPVFGESFYNQHWLTFYDVSTMWMVTENFRLGNPMNIEDTTKNQVRYQHRGYARYVVIAKLFGWEPLNNFWKRANDDDLKGLGPDNRNNDNIYDRVYRLSLFAGVDVSPLIHFWGVKIEPNKVDCVALKQKLQSERLDLQSNKIKARKIFDEMVTYRDYIPMNNAEFRAHSLKVNRKDVTGTASSDFGAGWYADQLPVYSNTHGNRALTALNNMINQHFPNGRP